MSELTKSNFIQSQFLVVLGLLEHTNDNIHGTVFEEDSLLRSVFSTLIEGCQIVKTRMEKLAEEDDDDCCC